MKIGLTQPNTDSCFDLYMVRGFFDAQMCGELITEMRRSPAGPATVYGQGEAGSVNERMRKATRLVPSLETIDRIRRRLLDYREEVGKHFGISLNDCEDPQFLRYGVGDFFVAHQDGNTGLLLLNREQSRKVSVVIFLNRQSEAPETDAYTGGSLVFSDWRAREDCREFRLPGEAGTMVAFHSEITHEVVPITHGERYSIVSWYV